MAKERPLIFALNAGEVSPLSLGRVDLQRMRLTAETYLNCLPRVIGPMSFRPGLEFKSSTQADAAGRNLPFIFSATDTALIELTDLLMRIRVAGELITRAAVSTQVTNGNFSSSVGWTLTALLGATADINSTTAGALTLRTLVRGSTASCTRSVSVSATDDTIEHAMNIVVTRGKVKFRLGTTSGADDLINETELGPGTHSLAFTPGDGVTAVHPHFSAESETYVIVDSCLIEGSGTFSIAAPWAAADLFELKFDQSGDVIFVTHEDYQTRRIERRGVRSWSITKYELVDGPFMGKTANVQLKPSVRVGNGTLTATAAFFKSTHVGALFGLAHTDTTVSHSLAGEDRYTDTVQVSGNSRYDIDADGDNDNSLERDITVTVSGTWSGTLSLWISEDEGATWIRTQNLSNGTITRTPGQPNTTILVRAGFGSGNYTSGTAVVTITYQGGGGFGVARVTAFTSSTVVSMEVVKRFHGIDNTSDWEEGKFSDFRGHPSSIGFFESRLWLGGSDKLYGSAVDDFTNFDVELLDEDGDSATIQRSPNGPVAQILWIVGLARLLFGSVSAEHCARSSSFDEPMTPTNFSIKDASTQGSANIAAVKMDRSAVYVQRSGKRAYVLTYSVEAQDYISQELTRYHPSVLDEGVKIMAIQRQPDTRIWFVLNDGTAVVLTYEPTEDVIAFCRIETDGDIEDVCVLPSSTDDDVWLIVNRTIDGSPKRYVEKLAYDHQAQGGNDNYIADSFKVVTLAASTTVTGLSHLEAADVVVWADGSPVLDADGDPEIFTVSGGEITLPSQVTGDVIVGLAYEGRWKSSKLAYGAQMGTALFQKKKVEQMGLLCYKTHQQAIEFGHDFDTMDRLPRMFEEEDQGQDHLYDQYDYEMVAVPGDWDTDARLCLKFKAPLPATVQAVGLLIHTNEG